MKRLDDLIAGDSDDAEFAEGLRRAITFIYTAGVTMPSAGDVYEDAGEEFWTDAVSLNLDAPDPAELEAAVTALAQRIITSVDAAQPEGDVEADDIEELAETTAGQILELSAALAAGSEHFDAKRLQEAVVGVDVPVRRVGNVRALGRLGTARAALGSTVEAAFLRSVDRVAERGYTCLRVALTGSAGR